MECNGAVERTGLDGKRRNTVNGGRKWNRNETEKSEAGLIDVKYGTRATLNGEQNGVEGEQGRTEWG